MLPNLLIISAYGFQNMRFNLKKPLSSERVKPTKVESASLIAITTAVGSGNFAAVSCTLPETVSFCEKVVVDANNEK